MSGKVVKVPIRIPLKQDSVVFSESNIPIYDWQLRNIKKQSRKYTRQEWLKKPNGLKIKLTTDQQQQLVQVKNHIVQVLAPDNNEKTLLDHSRYAFSKHARLRIHERIDRLSSEEIESLGDVTYLEPFDKETLEELTLSLIKSKEVINKAEWKGSPFLNFSFVCDYHEDKKLSIVVNFQSGILIVTLVVITDSGYLVREKYKLNKKPPFIE